MCLTQRRDIRTRGHEVTLVKEQCRLHIRKYSFSQRAINESYYLQIVYIPLNKLDCVPSEYFDFFSRLNQLWACHMTNIMRHKLVKDWWELLAQNYISDKKRVNNNVVLHGSPMACCCLPGTSFM